MSSELRSRPLSEFADEFEKAAEEEDEKDVADACAVLAAFARGEDPPADAARRVRQRSQEADR